MTNHKSKRPKGPDTNYIVRKPTGSPNIKMSKTSNEKARICESCNKKETKKEPFPFVSDSICEKCYLECQKWYEEKQSNEKDKFKYYCVGCGWKGNKYYTGEDVHGLKVCPNCKKYTISSPDYEKDKTVI